MESSKDGRREVVVGASALLVIVVGIWIYWNTPAPGDRAETLTVTTEHLQTVEPQIPTPAAPTSSVATSSDQDHDKWVRSIAEWLMAQDDARSQVSGVLLQLDNPWIFKNETERSPAFQMRMLDLMTKSAALAPDDASIQTLTLSMCMRLHLPKAGCNVADLEVALRKSDSANILAWLHSLAMSRKVGDAESEELALSEMAEAKGLDSHSREIGSMFRRAIESARVPPLNNPTGAMRPLDELLVDEHFPLFFDLSPIAQACGANPSGRRADQCARIAKSILADDNLHSRRVAWTIVTQLPANSATVAEVADAKRHLRRATWQRRSAEHLQKSEDTVFRINAGDAQTLETLLAQNGIALDPPEAWQP